MNLTKTSCFLCMILRHRPEVIGITLDAHGWADVRQLVEGVSRTRPFDRATLEEIVRTDQKQRYSFNEDGTKIRANQGHSIPVDVELEQCAPPEILWHGTAEKYEASIDAEGLKPGNRLYVHLSADPETAAAVGARHGKVVIYRVLSGRMAEDGFPFFRSVNGVWLTRRVPGLYLEKQTAAR